MVVTMNFYNKFFEFAGDNSIDLDNDTFKIALMTTDFSYTASHTAWSDVSANEIADGNGYSQATGGSGKNLANVTWTSTDGMQIFDADDVTWTAAGGNIGPAGHAIIFDDTSTTPTNDLLCINVNFGGDFTANDTTEFKITWQSTGIFHVS